MIRQLCCGAIVALAALPGSARTHPEWLSYSTTPDAALAALPADAFAISDERERLLRERGESHVDLLERTELQVGTGDELVQRTILVRRFLTSEGIQQWGNVPVGVRPAFELLSIDAAVVIQPTGERQIVDPASLQIRDAETGILFSDAKEVVLPFPNLRPGGTLVVIATRLMHGARWPLPWSQVYSLRGLGSVERFELFVSWETEAPAPQWWTNDSRVLCKQPDERRVECSRYKIDPFLLDPDVSNWGDLQSYVVVSRQHTWADLASIEASLISKQIGPMGELAIDVTSGSAMERLERIYRFVADEVRYVGVETATRAVVPQRAGETLALRYGDCKDKVTLFLALAQRAGLDAYPVLIGSRLYDSERVAAPSWRWFDHMIACVRGILAEPICLELTTPNAAVGQLPTQLHGSVALALAVDGDATGIRPFGLAAPRQSWPVRAEVVNRIDCGGNVEETLDLRFHGSAALAIREMLRPMNQADRIRWAEEAYEQAMGDTPKPDFAFSGLDSPESELTLSARNRFDRKTPLTELTHVAEPDYWLQYLSNGFKTANRHNPYRMLAVNIKSDVRYEFCETVSVRHGGALLAFQSEFGSLNRVYSHSGSTVHVSTTLDLVPRTVPVNDLDRLRTFLDRSLAQSPVWLGLEKQP